MTNGQKLSLRLSEIRQRLNEISGLEGDAVTDEVRSEADKLATEFKNAETQHRSALIAEADEQRTAEGEHGNGDGEPAEVRALLGRAGLADYVRAGISGREIAGAPSELNAALDCPIVGVDGGIAIPWRVIRGQRAPESRQAPDPERRTFTTTGAYDGPTTQQTILDELFGVGILDAMGVFLASAPAGAREYPIISGNVAPAQTAEGTAASAAVAASFEVANLRPKKLVAAAEFTHEMQASVIGLEETIRRNLMARIQSEMSNIVINRAGTRRDEPGAHRGIPHRDHRAGRSGGGGDFCRLRVLTRRERRWHFCDARNRSFLDHRNRRICSFCLGLSIRKRRERVGSFDAQIDELHGFELHPARHVERLEGELVPLERQQRGRPDDASRLSRSRVARAFLGERSLFESQSGDHSHRHRALGRAGCVSGRCVPTGRLHVGVNDGNAEPRRHG